MLDIKFVRDNPDAVKENIKKKFQDAKLPLVDEAIRLDAEKRAAQQECEQLKAARNKLSKANGPLYGQLKKADEAQKAELQKQIDENNAKVKADDERRAELEKKQACAAVGQARLMTIYQKLFGEYNQTVAQILMTKNTMVNNTNRKNAENTFNELLAVGVIPIVNENDSVSSYEFQNLVKFGDNDTLSSVVAALIGADLLILMSDIDGLFTDDPNSNPDAEFIDIVENMDDNMRKLGKSSTGSNVGTGGMATKLTAAIIATAAGTDMVIANGSDFHNIHRIVEGKSCGTLFVGNKKEEFFLIDYIEKLL